MAYRESVVIVRGVVGSIDWRAMTIAAISPVWLDWYGPGTRIALLSGWLSSNHMPLPQTAFSFPFSLHEPSV